MANTVYEILLLQLAPGKESTAIDKMRRELDSGDLFYVALGRYDAVVIRKRTGFSLFRDFQTKCIDDVMDYFMVCGLQWNCGSAAKELDQNKPFLGLSLIKLNPYHKAEESYNPVEVEMQLAKGLLEIVEGPVCCNLSNYECVCLVQADSLMQLSDKVIRIKEQLAMHKQSSLDITTIPAIAHSITKDSSKFSDKADVLVFLCLEKGLSQGLSDYIVNCNAAGKIAVNPRSYYGYHDIILECHGSFGDISDFILTLRKECKQYGLYSTYSVIAHLDKATSVNGESFVFEEDEDWTCNYNKTAEAALHFRQLINTSKRDFLTMGLFRDHNALIKKAIGIADEIKKAHDSNDMATYRKKLGIYDSLTDCLRQSFSQRFAGLAPGNLLAHRSLGLEPHGSIQRAILALESLPLYVLGKMKKRWSGFCTYGYTHKFYSAEGGIVTTPDDYRLAPEMWWGMFHELGHEFFKYLPHDLLSDTELIVEKTASEVFKTTSSSGLTISLKSYEESYTRFCHEIFAELFGYYFGFHSSWNLYLQKFWQYFSDEFPIDAPHIARSVLVKLSLGPDRDMRLVGITDDHLATLVDEIERVAYEKSRVRIDPSVKRRARIIAKSFLDLADKYAKWLIDQPQLAQYNVSDGDKITKILAEGIPYFGDNPIEVIFALMDYHDTIQLSMQVASILTLYNTYWKTYRSMPFDSFDEEPEIDKTTVVVKDAQTTLDSKLHPKT
ncbi:hypothetical protein MUO83_07620 [Candidatus Bathyarchaeota archaeon]|nr:hypothetical protein [Candidatus Bathyarchaeota archaeon]